MKPKDYYCSKCDKNHFIDSKIGKRHLKYEEDININHEVNHEVIPYVVILNLNGEEYLAEGETVLEALENLEPPFFKTNALIIVSYGENTAEIFLNKHRAERTFTNKLFKEVMAKNLLLRLG